MRSKNWRQVILDIKIFNRIMPISGVIADDEVPYDPKTYFQNYYNRE